MSNTVISVEKLSKLYKLGTVSTGTFKEDFDRWMIKLRGKEEDYFSHTKSRPEEYLWALQDVSFEVKQGEVLGIIGKNGAGKSTLLKILSRVTKPTSGQVKIKGRVASLLEVGTGFHPELTGRENIFLNGAILGMNKREIKSKFDEMVAFSGVDRFIDTPVKRYSSGMYVRLAFAVAAHLDPEILIVDEVLAVGDADFQKRCLGKMQDVTNAGRTILFVSHNLGAISSLSKRAILLESGKLVFNGTTEETIRRYFTGIESERRTSVDYSAKQVGDDEARLLSCRLVNTEGKTIEYGQIGKKVGVEIKYEVLKNGSYQKIPNIHLFSSNGEYVMISAEKGKDALKEKGTFCATVWFPSHLLNDGRYIIGVALSTMAPLKVHFFEKEALLLDVIEDLAQRSNDYLERIPGLVRPDLEWKTEKYST